MATITKGAESTTPTLILGWETRQTSATQTHELLSGSAVYTIRGATPPQGTFRLFYATWEDAQECVDLHAYNPGRFTIAGSEVPAWEGLVYVVTGDVKLSSTEDEGRRWIVEVDYGVISS